MYPRNLQESVRESLSSPHKSANCSLRHLLHLRPVANPIAGSQQSSCGDLLRHLEALHRALLRPSEIFHISRGRCSPITLDWISHDVAEVVLADCYPLLACAHSATNQAANRPSTIIQGNVKLHNLPLGCSEQSGLQKQRSWGWQQNTSMGIARHKTSTAE